MSAAHERRQRKWKWEPGSCVDAGCCHGWRSDRGGRRRQGGQHLELHILRCPGDPGAMLNPHRPDGVEAAAFREPFPTSRTAAQDAVTCPSPDGTGRTEGSSFSAGGAPCSTMGLRAASCWPWRA